MDRLLPCKVEAEKDPNSTNYDTVVIVSDCFASLTGDLQKYSALLKPVIDADKAASKPAEISLVLDGKRRVFFSTTGPLTADYDTLTEAIEATEKAVKRAVSAGSNKILLVLALEKLHYDNANLAGLLGALTALYVSEEAESLGEKHDIDELGVWSKSGEKLVETGKALHCGRAACMDIIGGSPRFMSPQNCASYIKSIFATHQNIKIEVIDDQQVMESQYPTTAAVGRVNHNLPEYQSRIVRLEYSPEGKVEETLMMVGKGVTLDTGGVDVKINGGMIRMNYDKGGAAAVAGFFKTLAILRPKGVKAIAMLAFVRNGIGANAYTCEEIIKARSGQRLRIINTDAEGRMAMLDPLCQMKEEALKETKPHLFTVATLTGHRALSYGRYTAAMDNGPAKKQNQAAKLAEAADKIGDWVQESLLKKEDVEFNKCPFAEADLNQCHSKPSSQTPRAHQIAMGFLLCGSGLDKHGNDSSHPIPYTHLDIDGWQGQGPPNGSPVLALANRFLLQRV